MYKDSLHATTTCNLLSLYHLSLTITCDMHFLTDLRVGMLPTVVSREPRAMAPQLHPRPPRQHSHCPPCWHFPPTPRSLSRAALWPESAPKMTWPARKDEKDDVSRIWLKWGHRERYADKIRQCFVSKKTHQATSEALTCAWRVGRRKRGPSRESNVVIALLRNVPFC